MKIFFENIFTCPHAKNKIVFIFYFKWVGLFIFDRLGQFKNLGKASGLGG